MKKLTMTTGTCLSIQLPMIWPIWAMSKLASFASLSDVKWDKKWKIDWSQIVKSVVRSETQQGWRLFVCYLSCSTNAKGKKKAINWWYVSIDVYVLSWGVEGCGKWSFSCTVWDKYILRADWSFVGRAYSVGCDAEDDGVHLSEKTHQREEWRDPNSKERLPTTKNPNMKAAAPWLAISLLNVPHKMCVIFCNVCSYVLRFDTHSLIRECQRRYV